MLHQGTYESKLYLLCWCAGVVVNVDTPEGSQVVTANQRYTEYLANAGSSDKYSSSCSQTPPVLLKHKEVQSGSSSNQTMACQATGFDIHDSYAAQNKDQGMDAEEQLGSVLPSGAVMSAGGHWRAQPRQQSHVLEVVCACANSICYMPTGTSCLLAAYVLAAATHSMIFCIH